MISAILNIKAIASKELRVGLGTWTNYVLLAGFIELSGLLFYILLRDFQMRRLSFVERRAAAMLEHMNLTDFVIGPTLLYVASILLFLVPISTMRSFASERKQNTFALLLTSPVPTWQIVAGKYCAHFSIMLVMVLSCLSFPVALEWLVNTGEGAIDWRTVATGFLGIILMGSLGVAIGMATSAATDSQLVAVVSSFGILLVLYVLGVAATGQPEPWQSLLRYLSINTHLQSLVRGIVRPEDIGFFISGSLVALLITERRLNHERWR